MTIKQIVSCSCIFVACLFCLLYLCACGPSDEEIITQKLTTEFESIKTLDSSLVDQISSDTNLQTLTEFGVTPQAFVSSFLTGFDYRIESISVDGDTASATVVFICKDYSAFNTALAEAYGTLVADGYLTTLSQEETNIAYGETLIATMNAIQPTESTPFTITFEQVDKVWMPSESADLAISQALIGAAQ